MKKVLRLTKVTIANLEENSMEDVKAGGPIFSSNPKKCETLVPLCVDTVLDCNQTGVTCI